MPGSNLDFVVRQHGPSVQRISSVKEPGRSFCQLISSLAFKLGPMNISCQNAIPGTIASRESHFHLRKNTCWSAWIKNNDHGCRHELQRIVKTIVRIERTSLGQLTSYYLKTAIMHYIKEKPSNWNGRNSLGEHFVGFLAALRTFLRKENLPNY